MPSQIKGVPERLAHYVGCFFPPVKVSIRKNKKIICLPHQKKQKHRQFDAAN